MGGHDPAPATCAEAGLLRVMPSGTCPGVWYWYAPPGTIRNVLTLMFAFCGSLTAFGSRWLAGKLMISSGLTLNYAAHSPNGIPPSHSQYTPSTGRILSCCPGCRLSGLS